MGIKNYEEITLDSTAFEQVRNNFDLLMQRLFQKMEQNNSDEGSITLKVDINMLTEFVPDEDGNSHRISKPVLKHKITTTVPVKDSFDGKKDTGMELVYDEELKRYVLKYVSVGGQRSMFDEDFPDIINGEGAVVDADAKEIESVIPLLGCAEDEENTENAENDVSTDSYIECEEIQDEEEENGADGSTEVSEYEYDDGDGYDYED